MISVIVPVYNVEHYLKRCVDSILNQTYVDLEIILIDDGSTDGCSALCDLYAESDDRIKVIHQDNRGLSSARNAGIEIATGEYIAFVDSDDYLLPHMYERLLAEMKDTEAEIVMCSYVEMNESGRFLKKENILEWCGSGYEFVKTNGLICNFAWNKLYCRTLFDQIRFPDGKFFEDIFVMHEVFSKARKVSLIPEAFYVYQRRKDSISRSLVSYQRMDYLEALIVRLKYLIQIDASDSALMYYVMGIYRIWERFYQAKMLADDHILEAWNRNYKEFRLITKELPHKLMGPQKIRVMLLRIHPYAYHMAYVNIDRIKCFFANRIKHLQKKIRLDQVRKRYMSNQILSDSLPNKVLQAECSKFLTALNMDFYHTNVIKQMESFMSNDITLKADHLSLSDDPCVPTVIVVVKNELERMKLFYDHYRKLGVHQFVVLDNDSDDGTFEFLLSQNDTRIYQSTETFQTQKKEGWIEKLMALTGYHRWYIVVDSDELLDYPGSENHPVEEMIRSVHTSGRKRINGYLVDMYPKEALFSSDCTIKSITENYRYFDTDGYYIKGDINSSQSTLVGGPRLRMFGISLTLSKQAMFYFDEQSFYLTCHSVFPFIAKSEMPTLFVLKHYKFLNKDYMEYQHRIQEKNFFNNSIEYRTIMAHFDRKSNASMYDQGSCEYKDSYSLQCLPYIETIDW